MSTSLIKLTGDSWTMDAAFVDFANSVLVTDHPTELGTPVSDHAQLQPPLITITATVSENPWSDKTNGKPFARRGDFLLFLDSCVGEMLIVSTEQYGFFSGYGADDDSGKGGNG
jgi:hypothetical protein